MAIAEERSLLKAIAALWRTLSRRRKLQFCVLLLVMIVASFAEVFSLGLIVPFLAALTAPGKVLSLPALRPLLGLLPGLEAGQLVVALAAIFCGATLLAAAVRVFLLYVSTGYSYALGADLGLEIYRRTLYQPYRVHISRNSSDVINGVIGKTNIMIANVIGQLMTLASSAFLMVGIVGALFAIDPVVTLSAMAAFAAIYGVILSATRRRLRRDSEIVARESGQVIKALQEGLGGIRDVLLDGTQETFSAIYQVSDRRTRAAQGRMVLTTATPRFLVEGLGMIFIALLAVTVSGGGQNATVVPILGALALGAQRLLPIVQQAYVAVVTIRGSEASLLDVLELLAQPLPDAASEEGASGPLPFDRQVELAKVSFSYTAETPFVLEDLDLKIAKGARVGIFGPTGGGKSTFLDLLMSLLEPTTGHILVDGRPISAANRRSWQRRIAHVPQNIYLGDTSVAENIAFGVPGQSIDAERVRAAAQHAQIAATIETWPDKYDTRVGERGVRLSGGQRQRIGIARALYKQADVIILDEATSALDNDTERDLIEAIAALGENLTIIMVAHRLTTLKHCDVVLEIAHGRITRLGTYEALLSQQAG